MVNVEKKVGDFTLFELNNICKKVDDCSGCFVSQFVGYPNKMHFPCIILFGLKLNDLDFSALDKTIKYKKGE